MNTSLLKDWWLNPVLSSRVLNVQLKKTWKDSDQSKITWVKPTSFVSHELQHIADLKEDKVMVGKFTREQHK